MGYDIHRLVPERKLILGGIEIPYDRGLAGHSDADVLVHAICDAFLGAAGIGDIGLHFPDTDPQYEGIYSIILLGKTLEMVKQGGFSVVNVDATIFAQSPKLSPFREAMRQKLSETIHIEPNAINIKATTTEGLGLIGSNDAMGSMAVVLLE